MKTSSGVLELIGVVLDVLKVLQVLNSETLERSERSSGCIDKVTLLGAIQSSLCSFYLIESGIYLFGTAAKGFLKAFIRNLDLF